MRHALHVVRWLESILAVVGGAGLLYQPLVDVRANLLFRTCLGAIGVVKRGTTELSPEIRVTPQTPPCFFAHAGDDRVSPENSVMMYLALRRVGVPAELHVYASGGHGIGLRPTGKPAATWPKRCEEWLRDIGMIQPSPSLVANPSFDEAAQNSPLPAGWSGNRQVFSRDPAGGRHGSASLKYVNSDPKRYCLATQRVPLQPGRKYRLTGWVKTEKITGEESGATFCIEWMDKKGKWLGGVYPRGVKGTRGWTEIIGVARVPEEAGSCSLACYVRQGMTGTAWFDDVQLVRVVDPPLQSVLTSPVYRGWITAAGPETIRAIVRLDLRDCDLRPQEVRLRARLSRASDGRAFGEIERQPVTRQGAVPPIVLEFPAGKLPVGQYRLDVALVRADGTAVYTVHHALARLPSDVRPRCAIDEHRRLLVDCQPFFPLGMYWSGINEADLNIYADSKFNCLMPYGPPTRRQMDLAQQHGLKVIYSVKDWYAGLPGCPPSIRSVADEERQVRSRVRAFRDHPALLAWYLNDELSQEYLPRLEAHQRWVAEEDRDHPTWAVLYQFREVAAYLKTFDVIGTDPYPIGRKPASMAAQWTAETFRQVERARPVWQVPQLHNWANYAKTEADRKRGRTPTYAEIRSMSWQCICEGATGLMFYSWYDLKRNPDVPFEKQWQGLKRLAAEIDGMAPRLLSIEPAPTVRIQGDRPGWLHWLVRSQAGKLYLVAANDGDGEGTVVFRLPSVPERVRLLGENRLIRSEGTALRVELPRLAVRLYEIELTGT